MEHPDLAQLAAVGGALGSVLVLLARGRVTLLAGLVVLAAAETGLALSLGAGPLGELSGATGAGAAAIGALLVGLAAAQLARRPALVPLVVLVAAPFRPPLDFDSSNRFLVSVADDGRLGRLLPRSIALPAAAFFAFACCSLLWASDIEAGTNLLAFFTLPFVALLATVGRAAFPSSVPPALALTAIALASLFALVGLWQAATHELFFYAPNLAVSNANTDFFRVTSLFGDPSLYGRHVVLGIGVVLTLLAARRWRTRPLVGVLVLLWAGLVFSYSQSSMAALLIVTLALAFATGDRRVQKAVGVVTLAAALAAGGYVAVKVIGDESLNKITSDRTERVRDTMRVVEEDPIIGVGIGGQPRASRKLAGGDRPTPNFVSHTTPLTVLAELGAIGLALYAWLLVGGVRVIAAVRRRDEALGLALGASFLALFVHALFYSGFLEDPITWLVLAVGGGYLTWTERSEVSTATERARRRMGAAGVDGSGAARRPTPGPVGQ